MAPTSASSESRPTFSRSAVSPPDKRTLFPRCQDMFAESRYRLGRSPTLARAIHGAAKVSLNK
jgi:hypothetical protein